jgi:hypothetical protein
MVNRLSVLAWGLYGVSLLAVSCGTGIEVTEHVTDKDVRKAIGQMENHQRVVTLDSFTDSVPAWRSGKRFWVADNQVRQLFSISNDYNLDTVNLAGHVLEYVGYDTGGLYDNRLTVNLKFRDSEDGKTFIYRTGKTIDEFKPGFSIPMLIDLDLVDHIARQVVNKDYYIRTPIWYDRQNGQMTDGRHFIKVHIDSVQPGNAVLPMRLLFTTCDTGEKAMVWMSDNASTMHGRDFDAMFVASDPRLAYPSITDANWDRIINGQVIVGMTKEECRLALGTPQRINQGHDPGGVREYWYYDGGAYLFFVDGLLNNYRL